MELETHHALTPSRPEHIWLLHHLFLAAVNADAQLWMQAWNYHKMQLKGERTRCPRDMYLFSFVQDGPRGIERIMDPIADEVEHPELYGIDWEAAADEQLMNHLFDQNPQEWEEGNPFTTGPSHQAHVPCEPPNCPFSDEQICWLDNTLALRVNLGSDDMVVRRGVWIEALSLCSQLYA